MKEDILEQLVDEYLQHKEYFTTHNVKFKPSKKHPDYNARQDSVHSDIDILAVNPKLKGADRILTVNCKSWQGGLNPESKIREFENNKIVSGREAWRGFRELIKPKWSEAFMDKIYDVTGSQKFTHVTAVTLLKGEREAWENHPPFRLALNNNLVKILTLNDMLDELYPIINQTPASSTVGRFLQVIKASGWLEKQTFL
jgi:hypothetical protein